MTVRTEVVRVRLDEAEHAVWRAAARRRRWSVSQVIREAMRQWLEAEEQLQVRTEALIAEQMVGVPEVRVEESSLPTAHRSGGGSSSGAAAADRGGSSTRDFGLGRRDGEKMVDWLRRTREAR